MPWWRSLGCCAEGSGQDESAGATTRAILEKSHFLDSDRRYEHAERSDRADAIIEESGLLPIWSNPCLEALILRHFPGCEHLRPPTSNLAREELLRRWPDYRKPMSRLELRKKFGASDVQHAAGTSLDLLRFLKEIGFAV